MAKTLKHRPMGALETTSYRFEAIQPKKDPLEYTCADGQRFSDVLRNRDYGYNLDGSLKAMMAAEWAEGSEEKANRVALGHSLVTRRQEVAMSKRVSLKVRQAALKYLLDNDHICYERELNVKDKAFYKDRI